MKIYSLQFIAALFVVGCMIFGAPWLGFAAPVYVYTEADGSTRISSRPPKTVASAVVYHGYKNARTERYVTPTASSSAALKRIGKRKGDKFHTLIAAAAEEFKVDPALVKAVIHVESDFRPTARSPRGARGLMQLMPATGARFGLIDPFNPKDNIYAGVRYLADLAALFPTDERLVLAAYNAGEGAVQKYKGIPPFAETQSYVRKVQELKSWYSADRH